MFYKKEGYPEEGELVNCTVTSVQYNSVFVNIEEYRKTGLIHISEISPGRIRNIRDYVKEGKMIVCKVLKINEKKGHIDLSLRRVTEMQKREKSNDRKQEQRAEKIITALAEEKKEDPKKVYDQVSKSIFEDYDFIYQAFEDVVENKYSLNIPSKYKELETIVKEKIKPKTVSINGTLSIVCFHPEGVEIVKDALTKAQKNENITIRYLGAGKYNLIVSTKTYKEAESILKESLETAKSIIEKNDGKVDFKRKE